MEASWMSPVVFPSKFAGASSGSVLVADARTMLGTGSHASVTCHAVCTASMRWLGGQRTEGLSVRTRRGGRVSLTITLVVHVATLPDASVAVNVTGVVPSG